MAGKHEGEKPKSEPFTPPAADKRKGDSDGGGGKHASGGKRK